MSDKKKALGRDPLAWIQSTGKQASADKGESSETPAPKSDAPAHEAEPSPTPSEPVQSEAPAQTPAPETAPVRTTESLLKQQPTRTVPPPSPGLPPSLAPSPDGTRPLGAGPRSHSLTNWPFVLIITLDMLLLVLLGYFAYLYVRRDVNAMATDVSNMRAELTSLRRQVDQLQASRPADKSKAADTADGGKSKSKSETGKARTGK